MSVEAVYAALKSRALTTGLPVHDSALVSDQDELIQATYYILFAPSPTDVVERFTEAVSVDSAGDYDVDVRVVAVTHMALLKAVDRLRTAFVGHRLALADRQCTPIKVEAGKAVMDRSIKPGLWVCDLGLLFTLRAT